MVDPKKAVARLKPYINGKNTDRLFENATRVMKLDSNESSLAPSPRAIASLTEFIQKFPLNWYPDLQAKKLTEKLAGYTQCPLESIQTFNGSDDALETTCKTFLESGDEVVVSLPTYDHFRVYAESCDVQLIPVHGTCQAPPPVGRLVEKINDRTRLIYIVNPSAAEAYSLKDIEIVLETASHAIVIVDEAYHEYCGITVSSLLAKYRNLIICRSLSKAFGLAGLRCGYMMTDPENLASINKVRIGKINSLTQVAACAVLDDLEYLERCVLEVQTAKKWLHGKLKTLGLPVVETLANYLFVETAHPKKVAAFLEKRDILVRANLPLQEGFIRITIGHQHLMERFWKVFEKIPASFLKRNSVFSDRPRRELSS